MNVRKCPRCEKDDEVELDHKIEVIAMMPDGEGEERSLFTCNRCGSKFYDKNPNCSKCGKDDRVEYKVEYQIGRETTNVVDVWYCNRCKRQFQGF